MHRSSPLARSLAALAVLILLAAPAAAAGPGGGEANTTSPWNAWIANLVERLGFVAAFAPEDPGPTLRSSPLASGLEAPEEPAATTQDCSLECSERSGMIDPNG